MVNFKELSLDTNIYKAISACGYTKPTPVQAQSIPHILAGKDIVASAQTGTGKTAAFVLPALHRLSTQQPIKKTRILILTPTRELANQITKAAGMYGKFLQFNIVNLVGGMPYHQQIRELARGADIIVATPGRLLDHIEQKRVNLSHVEMLVLDEADRMLDMGFIDDVQYIAKLTPQHRQTLLFSATVDKQLTNIVKSLLKNPVRVDLSSEKITAPQIEQRFYKTTNAAYKSRLLRHLLQTDNIYKAIIFSATKINADKLTDYLRDHGHAAAALHGDLKQNARNRTLEQFRRGKIQYLIATDVAARGIDVSDITHVFNYDLPKFCEDYVHRIGRTGRAGRTGIAISFVSPSDAHHLKRIERYVGQRLQATQYPEFKDAPAVPQKHDYKQDDFSFKRAPDKRSSDRRSSEPFGKKQKSNEWRDHKPHKKDRKEAKTSDQTHKEFKPKEFKSKEFKPFSKKRKPFKGKHNPFAKGKGHGGQAKAATGKPSHGHTKVKKVFGGSRKKHVFHSKKA